MDEIVIALNGIAEVLANDGLPLWLTTIDVILPIILAGVTIGLSIRMDQGNKKLQKQIHNRDVANQTRQAVLHIFQSYFNALTVLQQVGDNVASVFVSDQSYYQWGLAVESSSKDVTLALNKAKLLLGDDEELVDYLRKSWLAFSDVNHAVNTYINTGIASQTVGIAWSTFQQKYNIQCGNYFALLQNPSLAEEFKKICDNSYTQDIQRKSEIYMDLVTNDEFEGRLRKYIQIQELK